MADEFIHIDVDSDKAKKNIEELRQLFSKLGFSTDQAGERLDHVFGEGAVIKFEKIYRGLYVNEKTLRSLNDTAQRGIDGSKQRIEQLETELSLTDEADKKKRALLEQEKDRMGVNLEMHKKIASAIYEQMKAQKELEAELQSSINKQTYQANPQAGGVLNSFKELKAQADAAGVIFDNLDARTTRALNHINDGINVSAGDLKKIINDNKETIRQLEDEQDKLGKVISAAEMDKGIKEQAKKRIDVINDEITARKKLGEVVETAQKQKATGNDAETVRIRTRIMNLKQEIMEYRNAGKAGSEYYQGLIKEVQTLQAAQRKLNSELQLLSSAHPMTQSIITGLRGISGGFAAAQGAMALFGSENKDLQKVMTKLQALMSITIGLQSVQAALDKSSAMGLVLRTKATNALNKVKEFFNVLMGKETVLVNANTRATIGNTAAIQTNNAALTKQVSGLRGAWAMLKNGIKGLKFNPLIALGAVAAGIAYKMVKSIKNVVKANEEFKKSAAEISKEPISQLELLSAKWKRLSTLKEQKQFIKDNKTAFDELGVSINNVREAQDLLVKNKDKYIQYLIDIATAQAYLKKNDDLAIKRAEQLLTLNQLKKTEKKAREARDKARSEAAKNSQKNAIAELSTPMRGGFGGDATMGGTSTSVYNVQEQFLKSATADVKKAEKALEETEKELAENTRAALNIEEGAEKMKKEAGFKESKKDTKTKQKQEQKQEIELEKQTLETRIAYYKQFYKERRELLDEDNISGLKVFDDAEVSVVGELYDKLFDVEKAALEKQKAEYEKTANKTITDEQAKAEKMAEIEEWYSAKLKKITQEQDSNKSALGGTAQAATEKLFAEMVSGADTTEKKLELLNTQIGELQKADDRTNAQNKWLKSLQKQANDLNADIAAKRKADLEKLLQEYGEFTDRKREIDKQYANDVALIDKQLEQAREKGSEEQIASLERTKQTMTEGYQAAIKNLGYNYIRGFFTKAFDPKASLRTIKKALKAVSDLATKEVPDEGILKQYDLTPEQWEQIKEKIQEIKEELEDLAEQKEGGTIQETIFGKDIVGKFKELKKAMEIDPETGKIKDLGKALESVAAIGQFAGEQISKLGEAFSQWGELTDNSTLSEYGQALQDFGTVVSSTASGLASGGVYGAIAGFAGGVFSVIQNDMQKFAEEAEKRAEIEERTSEALSGFKDKISGVSDALQSFEDTLASLNYLDFDKAILDLERSFTENRYTDGWGEDSLRSLVAATSKALFNTDPDGLSALKKFLQQYGYDYERDVFDIVAEDGQADIEDLKRRVNEILRNIYSGYNDDIAQIIDEIKNMQDDPNTTTLQIFNKVLEARRKNLEFMRMQLQMMETAGLDTTALRNEIEQEELALKESISQMVGAFAGIDVAAVVDDWIKIFDEFGTSGQTAMDKINQSVDNMVANMLKQRLVVKKLQEEIDNIWSAADRDDDGQLTEDEMEEAIDSTRNAAEAARRYYEQLQQALAERGISLDETTGNSFSSAVKGVSEETAGIIAGQMNAIRVHQIEIQDILQNNIAGNIQIIADNSRYLQVLPQMNDRLGRVETAINNNYQQRIGSGV